jgi:transposase InsO family protein
MKPTTISPIHKALTTYYATRTIARHLVRAGIAVSRATVQRVLREPRPTRPPRPKRPPMEEPIGAESHHLLQPTVPGQVVHMDMIGIRLLWFRFTVAVILDGFSRKMLAVRAYTKTPCTRNLAALVRRTCAMHGSPKFLITDHGCQFQREFTSAMKTVGIRHAKGRVRAPYLNGKIERSFRTFRIWWRLVLNGSSLRSVQRRLDAYCHWYNTHRPHSAHGVLTPNKAWRGDRSPRSIPIRAADHIRFAIDVTRRRCRGDPRLPVICIHVCRAA